MQPTVWHVMVALLLIAYFFAIAGFFAYLLYGPGIDIQLPSYFAVEDDTIAAQGTSTEVVPLSPPPVPLPPPAPASEMIASFPGTLFVCEGNKALKAEFREGSVRLALSDGRALSLPQTVSSESEATYANTNGSFAFQTKDQGAFIEENGVITYTGCVIQQ